MEKIMFDTNIFDKILKIDIANIIVSNMDIEIYVTSCQVEEISNILDEDSSGNEKRRKLFLALYALRPKLVPTITIVEYARTDLCMLPSEKDIDIYHNIFTSMGQKEENIRDIMIASTAVRENCVLVTEDKDLYKAMKKLGYHVAKWEEFIEKMRI